MKRLLLLAALCMAAVLAFAPMAAAQSASASAGPGAEGNPCGSFEPGSAEADECYADLGVEPPTGDVGLATSVPPSESASPSADPCPDPDFPRETPDGCQASDLPDVEVGPDASPTASPTASALPDTGGPNPAAFALPSLALLVASGIFAVRIVRR